MKKLPYGYSERTILFQGKWVSWEFYKNYFGIDEHGYIGDSINGKVVHVSKYESEFIKELNTFMFELLQLAREEGYEKAVKEWSKRSDPYRLIINSPTKLSNWMVDDEYEVRRKDRNITMKRYVISLYGTACFSIGILFGLLVFK